MQFPTSVPVIHGQQYQHRDHTGDFHLQVRVKDCDHRATQCQSHPGFHVSEQKAFKRRCKGRKGEYGDEAVPENQR